MEDLTNINEVRNTYKLYDDHKDFNKAHVEIDHAVKNKPKAVSRLIKKWKKVGAEDSQSSDLIHLKAKRIHGKAYTIESVAPSQLQLLKSMGADFKEVALMRKTLEQGDKALGNPALRAEMKTMLDKILSVVGSDPALLQRLKGGFKAQVSEELCEEASLAHPLHKLVSDTPSGVGAQKYFNKDGSAGFYFKNSQVSTVKKHLNNLSKNKVAGLAHDGDDFTKSSAVYDTTHAEHGAFKTHVQRGFGGAHVIHLQPKTSLKEDAIQILSDLLEASEVEQIDELSRGTLSRYVVKASREAADLAVTSKGGVYTRHLKKANKRLQGVKKAAQKLGEEAEQIDELSKGTLRKYGDAAHEQESDIRHTLRRTKNSKHLSSDTKDELTKLADRRKAGIKLAGDKRGYYKGSNLPANFSHGDAKVPATEEVEKQEESCLNEISQGLKHRYLRVARTRRTKYYQDVAHGDADYKETVRKDENRDKGIARAARLLAKAKRVNN